MEKRILLTLLVIPMGALAWHEDTPHMGEATLGTQSATVRQPTGMVTTGGATLGTQSATGKQCRVEQRLGTQAVNYVTVCDGEEVGTGTVTTGGPEAESYMRTGEATLGTQSATIRQPMGTVTTGGPSAQSYTR